MSKKRGECSRNFSKITGRVDHSGRLAMTLSSAVTRQSSSIAALKRKLLRHDLSDPRFVVASVASMPDKCAARL